MLSGKIIENERQREDVASMVMFLGWRFFAHTIRDRLETRIMKKLVSIDGALQFLESIFLVKPSCLRLGAIVMRSHSYSI